MVVLLATRSSFVKLSLACRRHSTAIPGSHSHVHFLVFSSCDVELVVGAVFAVIETSFVVLGGIQGKVVSAGDIVHVVVHLCVSEVFFVEINWHEELSVIAYNGASFCSHIFCPQFGRVAVIRVVLLAAPRVSQLHKFDVLASGILDLYHSQDSVGMSIGEAYCVLSRVVAAISSALDDVVSLISSFQRLP